ncbi:MAG: transcriptional regulator [Glaciihabitans sp.]|nr:transcriptional regulator [Glaciihabitans sp.]
MSEQTSRILTLLNLLQTHRHWPGSELAVRLGVTTRTLRRDIDRLRELGYRVDAARGSDGGYRLEAGATLPPLLLTDDETVTMAIGLRIAAAQGLADGEQTTLSALAKLEQVLPSALRQRVNALAAAVQTQAPSRGGTPVSPDLLGLLALSCRDRERIRFHYVAADGAATDRSVEPHSLVTRDRTWFFLCWDLAREDWRTFRVDRMTAFFGTRVHFEPRRLPAPNASEFVANSLGSLWRGTHNLEVILAMPYAAMTAHFGAWASGATALDAQHTVWPVGGDTMEAVFSALAWIPAGVAYELRGSADVMAFIREAGERLSAAAATATAAAIDDPVQHKSEHAAPRG